MRCSSRYLRVGACVFSVCVCMYVNGISEFLAFILLIMTKFKFFTKWSLVSHGFVFFLLDWNSV